MIRTELI